MKNKFNLHIATYVDSCYRLFPHLECTLPTVIRLGGTKDYTEYPVQVNSAEGIKNSVNKLKSKELFDKAGVRQSPFYLDVDKYDQGYPCVYKPFKRSGGKGTEVVEDKATLKKLMAKGEGYIEPLFVTTSEYRVFATTNGCFLMIKKIRTEGHENEIIVTRDNHSYRFEFVQPRLKAKIFENCLLALSALGLDFACFDIGYSSKGNHDFVIFESNTGPDLELNKLVIPIAEALNEIIVQKTKQLQQCAA